MKRLLVMGMIAISTLSTIATATVFASEFTESNAVSDNGDVDTYSNLLLDRDAYDRYGEWTSSSFAIPYGSSSINLYYQNNGQYRTEVRLFEVDNEGRIRDYFSFIVSPGDRVVRNPYVQRNYSYYVKVVSLGGGSVEGNLRVAAK